MATSTVSRQASGDPPFQMRTILAPLVAIIVGAFMVMLDSTAMNVTLPSLVSGLHSTLARLQWTITGYALAQAAVIPLAGWLSDRFGAKRVLLLAMALFTAGSALCATAQSDGMLVVYRVLQGLGGGVVVPIGLAYTYRLSPPSKIGLVMGLMGIPIMLAPAVAPVVAGWLVQYASWRFIFLLNLPIGVLGVLIGLRSLPPIGRQAVPGLDLPGMILGPLAFAALSYGISESGSGWTSEQTLGGLLVGGVALLAFVGVELRAKTPLLELRVFKSFDFSLGIVVQWVSTLALVGPLFLVPLFLQQARGYGAFATGLILLPQAIAAAIAMPLGGKLFDRVGVRPLVVLGLGLVAVAAALLAHVGVTTTGADLVAPLAMSGAGMGLMMMTLTTYLIQTAPRQLVSRVTALTNALRQVVTAFSVATLATILTAWTNAASVAVAAQGPAAGPGNALHIAMAMAFDDTFRVLVAAGLVAAALGLLLRRRRVAGKVEVAAVRGEAVEGGVFAG